jgi:type II secretory pathway pseudopilin PulG
MRLCQFVDSRRRGFTLVEAMTAVTLVVIACSAMLLSVSQAMQASEAGRGANRGNMLAQELMTEISACRWADPTTPSHWGVEADEVGATRAAFDDLDDYDGWSGPPQTRDGVTFDDVQQSLFPAVSTHEYRDYTCTVAVQFVSSTGLVLNGTSSLYRQVTIDVTHPRQPPVQLNRIFYDPAPLLGRTHWFDRNLQETVAQVQIVP